MATSRTGTTRWKAIVAKRRRQAQRDGIDHCPRCGILLDYNTGSRARNSVEVDHIIPVAQGGVNSYDNSTVLCGRCNRTLGEKKQKSKLKALPSITPKTSRQW